MAVLDPTSLDATRFQDGQIQTVTAAYIRTLADSAFALPLSPNGVQASTYTAQLSDRGTLIQMTSGSATTFTIPPSSSVAFDVGTTLSILQYGAGQVTFVPATGVTFRPSSSLTTRAQYSIVSFWQRAINEWIAFGDLT